MMKRLHAALAAALFLLGSAPAFADFTFQAGGATITQGATVVGGKSRSHFILYDQAGNPALTSANPGFFSLTGSLPLPTNAATADGQATTNAALGAPANPAWDGSAASATQTSILKALWSKLSGLLTVDTVVRSTSANRGAVLTTASTAATLVPANTARRGLVIQNRNAPGTSYSAASSVFMNCLTTATTDFNSLEIPAGALYETPSHHSGTGACSFISATANTPVYVREF